MNDIKKIQFQFKNMKSSFQKPLININPSLKQENREFRIRFNIFYHQ